MLLILEVIAAFLYSFHNIVCIELILSTHEISLPTGDTPSNSNQVYLHLSEGRFVLVAASPVAGSPCLGVPALAWAEMSSSLSLAPLPVSSPSAASLPLTGAGKSKTGSVSKVLKN